VVEIVTPLELYTLYLSARYNDGKFHTFIEVLTKLSPKYIFDTYQEDLVSANPFDNRGSYETWLKLLKEQAFEQDVKAFRTVFR
jgi:hypothetical protein